MWFNYTRSTSHSFFHAERESRPDFEDRHRATWHLNPQIPIQRTEKDFDVAEHVCWPSAQHHLPVPSPEYRMKMLMNQAGLLQMLVYRQ